MTLKIKKSSKSKRPYLKHNHKVFFGFKVSKIPSRFSNPTSKVNIDSWFNYKGFTFIEKEYFKCPMTGKYTIE